VFVTVKTVEVRRKELRVCSTEKNPVTSRTPSAQVGDPRYTDIEMFYLGLIGRGFGTKVRIIFPIIFLCKNIFLRIWKEFY
jgi:hypothetical protein